jgi:hypothetical protein
MLDRWHFSARRGSERKAANALEVPLDSDHCDFFSSFLMELFLGMFWCEFPVTVSDALFVDMKFDFKRASQSDSFTAVQRYLLTAEKNASTAGDDTVIVR